MIAVSLSAKAQIAFEQDVVTDTQLKINFDDFNFESSSDLFQAEIIKDSLKWRRNSDQHLNPYVKIEIKNNSKISQQKLKMSGVVYNPTVLNDSYIYTVDYNLFEFVPLEIFNQSSGQEQKLAVIKLILPSRTVKPTGTTNVLYDYSCAPYQLKIMSLTQNLNSFITTRCQIDSYGEWGKETSLLTISLQSPELNFANNTKIVQIKLKNGEKAEVSALSLSGQPVQLRLEAQVPQRFYRMKTALGFGPYVYQTKDETAVNNPPWSDHKTTASYMFYGRYDLTQLSSIKFFDALIATETVFNNFGVYFSYDLASALDQRIIINALLGVQGIHYRYPGESNLEFTSTAPQGFEMIYKHAFGLQNYNFTYGGFFSTRADQPYTNTWVRFGKGYFWELNYIKWEYEKKSISMYGLSVGIPFMQFF